MNNIYVLERLTEETNSDNALFQWAKKIESIGYIVSQIWETEYPNKEDIPEKGINFKHKVDGIEIIFLCLTDNSVYVEIEDGTFDDSAYIVFLNKLTK